MMSPPALLKHLDTSVLADIRALGTAGEDVLAERARLFCTEVPGQLTALLTAVDACDAESAWQIAHRVKGTAQSIGAWQMARICGTVEYAADGQALDWATAHAAALVTEFESARLALEQEVRR
jgi:HPt (histidine-containing phosphotransfer) domain-containing protein